MAQIFKKECVLKEDYIHSISEALPEAIDEAPALSEAALEAIAEEAYQRGFDAGKTQRIEQAEEELSLLMHSLKALLASIKAEIDAHYLALGADIAPIMLVVMQAYLGDHLLAPEALQHHINQILKQINQQQQIELCLHPQDVIALHSGRIKINAQHIKGISIKSDDSLSLGGCVIKTDHGLFDASLDKQIDRLKDYLRQLKQRPSACTA